MPRRDNNIQPQVAIDEERRSALYNMSSGEVLRTWEMVWIVSGAVPPARLPGGIIHYWAVSSWGHASYSASRALVNASKRERVASFVSTPWRSRSKDIDASRPTRMWTFGIGKQLTAAGSFKAHDDRTGNKAAGISSALTPR